LLGTKGWTPYAAGVLLVGDYIQGGYWLYRVLDDVNADDSGNAVIPIWPSIREQPYSTSGPAGFTNATGGVTLTAGRPLGSTFYSVAWTGFGGFPLPSDAVVQGIYAVIVCSAAHDGAAPFISYFWPGSTPLAFPGSGGIGGGSGSFSSTEFNSATLGTLTDLLATAQIKIELDCSLFLNDLTDYITASAVGYAIYYTSATPTTDGQIPPPFAVPAGQGLSWALPVSVKVINGNPSLGTAAGTPATNGGGIVVNNPKGLWRLASNKRGWSADVARFSTVSFPFKEYR
jgi:hypothetical protein